MSITTRTTTRVVDIYPSFYRSDENRVITEDGGYHRCSNEFAKEVLDNYTLPHIFTLTVDDEGWVVMLEDAPQHIDPVEYDFQRMVDEAMKLPEFEPVDHKSYLDSKEKDHKIRKGLAKAGKATLKGLGYAAMAAVAVAGTVATIMTAQEAEKVRQEAIAAGVTCSHLELRPGVPAWQGILFPDTSYQQVHGVADPHCSDFANWLRTR